MADLQQRLAYITGASSGFGAAIARSFAEAGIELVLFARRMDRLEELQKELERITEVHIVQYDVSAINTNGAILDFVLNEYGCPDILVNNAGLALGMEPAFKAEYADWLQMINTNIIGLTHITHHLLPHMVKKNTGHIINIGSTAGNWPYKGGNAYGGTKAFVKNFSQQLRCDLAGTGIKVTNLEPGLAETEFSVVRFKGNHAQANQVYDSVQPLTAQDIADTVLWLINTPAHVNVNRLEMMPVCQTLGGMQITRD